MAHYQSDLPEKNGRLKKECYSSKIDVTSHHTKNYDKKWQNDTMTPYLEDTQDTLKL